MFPIATPSCDLHREILFRSEFDQVVERWVVECPPPSHLNSGLRDSRVALLDPVSLDFCFWRIKVGTYRTAANREQQAQQTCIGDSKQTRCLSHNISLGKCSFERREFAANSKFTAI